MCDPLPAIERTAKAIRDGFALLGAMADACIPAKANVYRELYQAADGLAEREAEEEVAEPMSATFDDEPSEEALNNITGLCCCYDPRVVQPCGPCRFGDGPCVNLPQSPAVSATDSAVEDPSPDVPPASGEADSLTWTGWALPAIFDVLADHRPAMTTTGYVICWHIDGTVCCECIDYTDWRHHVAPEIADRIGCDPARAAKALASYTPK
jgi:hypothetical protein